MNRFLKAAQWMWEELQKHEMLEQEYAAYSINEKYGDECTYYNDNGNLAIEKQVLKKFRELTEDKVVWSKGEKTWRLKDEADGEGRLVG